MAVGIDGRTQDQSLISRRRILVVELTRGWRAIDPNVRVMDDLRIAWSKFQATDVPRGHDRNADHEDARDVRPVGRQQERARQRDDEIGLADLPSFGPAGLRKVSRIAFSRSAGDPPLQHADLGLAQVPLSDELAVTRLRLPRGHEAAFRDCRDLSCALPCGGIREQTEGSRTARVMAHPAVVEDDGRHIAGEGDLTIRRLDGTDNDARRCDRGEQRGPECDRRPFSASRLPFRGHLDRASSRWSTSSLTSTGASITRPTSARFVRRLAVGRDRSAVCYCALQTKFAASSLLPVPL